jgi:serine/threonine protein kinase
MRDDRQWLEGRYRIIKELGRGNFAIVYLAEDRRLPGHLVAIKKFDPRNFALSDRAWTTQRFEAEAMILASLSHPDIAHVNDYFQVGESAYLVMEYVQGETLESLLSRSPGRRFSENQVLFWADQLGQVIDYLHGQSPPVIYRDLKQSNIMVQPDVHLKLIDFGIARYFRPDQSSTSNIIVTVEIGPVFA